MTGDWIEIVAETIFISFFASSATLFVTLLRFACLCGDPLLGSVSLPPLLPSDQFSAEMMEHECVGTSLQVCDHRPRKKDAIE